MRRFHYAFKVKDIESTRRFYIEIMGCEEGRSTESWIDFNFFGNQLSAHISSDIPELDFCGVVDGINVPIPHFGCLLEVSEFIKIEEKLQLAGIKFIIKPQKRYEGKMGEQMTMFLLDYSGNPIELKAYAQNEEIFKL